MKVKSNRTVGNRYGTIITHSVDWLSKSTEKDEGRIAAATEKLLKVPLNVGFVRGNVMVWGEADLRCPALCRWSVYVGDRDRPNV